VISHLTRSADVSLFGRENGPTSYSRGGPCCDGSDTKRVDDADWEAKDGHYRVRIDGEWVDVPNEAVVDGPNRAGRTMVWPYYIDGHPKARCFMPGSMG
jgi:hypothetical protein